MSQMKLLRWITNATSVLFRLPQTTYLKITSSQFTENKKCFSFLTSELIVVFNRCHFISANYKQQSRVQLQQLVI